MNTNTIYTASVKETHTMGANFGVLLRTTHMKEGAVVVAIEGELGSGKTTFVQGVAAGLGIVDIVRSPTFVIMKSYTIQNAGRMFYHIDCYRVAGSKDLLGLGWEEIAKERNNIVAVEWPERVADILPQNIIRVYCTYINSETRQFAIIKP